MVISVIFMEKEKLKDILFTLENVIDAILTIYDKGNVNEIYNIANTECYKVIDLAKIIN